MPFGVVSGVGREMGVLDGVVIIKREWAVLGVNLGRPVVTIGAFVAYLCGSAYSDRAVICGSEWVSPGIDVHMPQGKRLFLAFFGICAPIRLNGQNDALFAEKCIRLVCEKLTIFPYGQYIVGIYVSLAF